MEQPADEPLIAAMLEVTNDLDLNETLRRILNAAIEVSGAQYGAVAVLGENMQMLDFVAVGIPQEEQDRIGAKPLGRGLLGELIRSPMPLRLARLADHPSSVGFPPNHPPMEAFLGVPLRHGNNVVGNLYLTNKDGGFTAQDERRLVGFSAAAGIAIRNARLYEAQLERQRWQEAAAQISMHALAGDDSGAVIQTAGARAGELCGADVCLVLMPHEEGYQVESVWPATDTRAVIQLAGSTEATRLGLGTYVSADAQLLAVADGSTRLLEMADDTGLSNQPETLAAGWDATQSLAIGVVVPLQGSHQTLGYLVLGCHADRRIEPRALEELRAFVDQTATILALSAERDTAERLQLFQEKDRIARDLHDYVVQRLFAIGVRLQTLQAVLPPGLRQGESAGGRIEEMLGEVDEVIREIRQAISDLRATKTDLRQAISNEAVMASEHLGFQPEVELAPAFGDIRTPALVNHVSVAVRECLSNVARHAKASSVLVWGDLDDGELVLKVTDDGSGSDDPDGRRSGLRNLAARCKELGGTQDVQFLGEGQGTAFSWRVPVTSGS